MSRNRTFAVLIISHGRPDNIVTLGTLARSGYTGKIYIIIDNQDKTSEDYYRIYGRDNVIMFDKEAIAKTTDNGDNFQNYRSTTHARNACFGIAEKLGLDYFMVLDDDYTNFQIKFDERLNYHYQSIKNLDAYIEKLVDYFHYAKSLKTLCIAQGGDFIGGDSGAMGAKIWAKRKAMNTWICSPKRPIKFISRLNEDVNTYLVNGMRGDIYLTTNHLCVIQKQTQTNAGGMSDAYLESGTFVKSFYSVMYCPAFVKCGVIGTVNKRIHHLVDWKSAVPKIVRQDVQKK